MDKKFSRLSDLGVGDFEHLDGSLADHLKGTQELLSSWSASFILQDAGLFHAVYGTAGFEESLISKSKRYEIAKIIGVKSEGIVYQYCACDREFFFPQIGVSEKPEFKNRFTGESYFLGPEMMRNFCELTVANEIEIARGNPPFIREHGEGLRCLFSRMSPYLSEAAQTSVEAILGIEQAMKSEPFDMKS